MTAARVVVCSEIADPRWRWLEPNFRDSGLKFEFAWCVPRNAVERTARVNLARLRGSFEAVRLARRSKASALVAHGPTMAVWCALFARALGLNIPILAHSFNFTALPSPAKRRVFSFALSQIDTFVVFSTAERDLYARAFALPADRFDVVRWAVRPPEVDSSEGPLEKGEYVSAIGGNARDYRTLVAAAHRLPDMRFVFVVRPDNLSGLDLPPNVTVHTNLPFGQAMNVLAYSRFMVLPLVNSEVPCGHVTLVAAMHLGKAFVITDSSGVSDYVRDGENALTVAAGSVQSLVAATKKLWDDRDLCSELATNGQRFAAQECTEERAVDHFRRWLESQHLVSRSN
jgi:glycosyltransferase involved in cell wall biosynthesis